MDAQIRIRQEAQEKQDVLADLLRWQPETSKRSTTSSNKSARSAGPAVPGKQAGLAPLRGQRGSVHGKQTPPGVAPQVLRESANSARQSEAGTAAKHTYDYFKDKWDKFDYDAALADDDDENSTQKQAAAGKQAAEMQHQMKNLRKANAPIPQKSKQQQLSPHEASDAELWKDRGNNAFTKGAYADAKKAYTQSIALEPTCLAYANRAMAKLKLKEFAAAKDDCTHAIQLDASYTKAYLRRASAFKELGQLLEAAEDYEHALRLEPTSKVTVAERRACLDLLFQQEQLQHQLPRTSLTSPAQQPLPTIPTPSSRKPDVTSAETRKQAKDLPVNSEQKADKPDAQRANAKHQRPTQPSQSLQQPFGRRGAPSCVIEELPNEPDADIAPQEQPGSAPKPSADDAVQSNKKQRTKQQISGFEQSQKPEIAQHERTVDNAVQSSSPPEVSVSAAAQLTAKEAKPTSSYVSSSETRNIAPSQPSLKPPAPPTETQQQALNQQTAPTLPEIVVSVRAASSSQAPDLQTDDVVQSQSLSSSNGPATPLAKDAPNSLPVPHAQTSAAPTTIATQNAGNHSAATSSDVAQPSLQSPVEPAGTNGTKDPQVPVHESLEEAQKEVLKMEGHAAASPNQGAVSSAAAAAAQPSSSGLLDESIKPSPPPPRSGSEFEVSWKRLKGHDRAKEAYLRQLDPMQLPKIFKQSLTPAALYGIVTVALGLAASQNDHFGVQLLENMKEVPRFDMIVLGLPRRDKVSLKESFDAAVNAPIIDSMVAKRLGAVRKSYRV